MLYCLVSCVDLFHVCSLFACLVDLSFVSLCPKYPLSLCFMFYSVVLTPCFCFSSVMCWLFVVCLSVSWIYLVFLFAFSSPLSNFSLVFPVHSVLTPCVWFSFASFPFCLPFLIAPHVPHLCLPCWFTMSLFSLRVSSVPCRFVLSPGLVVLLHSLGHVF